jgi:hypothetical protein
LQQLTLSFNYTYNNNTQRQWEISY